jgi:hypothetical protein
MAVPLILFYSTQTYGHRELSLGEQEIHLLPGITALSDPTTLRFMVCHTGTRFFPTKFSLMCH